MKQIMTNIWNGVQLVGGFILGFCGLLVVLVILGKIFEALQRLVS